MDWRGEEGHNIRVTGGAFQFAAKRFGLDQWAVALALALAHEV